ncbi:PHP domain-containing protein [Natrarchaeobius chitinivorans]|uniref:histidinol-phosphatase n=1 Tax=Natrarchaeobius chitinivorans TaxID=1679083 RepID=A0A3N6MLE8_NATCH|nr:PHP domain-containing protein [Natrarchaeobius chitinivorans]RQG98110.1 PHP domain-containing protein [Natrarchaeobius chitinivorans]
MQDFHAHSNYSDGGFLEGMARSAESAGLEGIGFTDHCNVSPRERLETVRSVYGFNLDITYERRRRAIERLREETSLAIYDAVEMDYDPRDEPEIRAFLEEAAFDYALGSVHEIRGMNVQVASNFVELADDELDAIVEDYVETLVSLIESELFDVAAHVDLIARTSPLRGRATDDHYRRIASAFASSRTVPEINAGRALTDEEIVHPSERFLEVLREFDVPVTVGTDSHRPAEVGDRADFLREFVAEYGVDPVAPPGLERPKE